MGNSSSIENYIAKIETKNGGKFNMSYHSLVEHILLLRAVINHPDVTKDGPLLDYLVKDYCKRMAQDEMRTKDQQSKLPWQIEWIWHVHRLHPLAYLNDCSKLSNGLVDKEVRKFIKPRDQRDQIKSKLSSTNTDALFIPSIYLKNAVIRQNDFLKKFQKHTLYSHNLKKLDKLYFQNLVQNYISFIKLAEKGQTIIPTFDIDLIWHTHMRFPSRYQEFSTGLCGFILNHDDSIESNILTDAYKKTADRWKQTYQSEYEQNGSMKDAPQRHLLPTPKSSPNPNRDSPSARLVPTPSTIRKASIVGEQVSLGSKCPGSNIRVTEQNIDRKHLQASSYLTSRAKPSDKTATNSTVYTSCGSSWGSAGITSDDGGYGGCDAGGGGSGGCDAGGGGDAGGGSSCGGGGCGGD
jgi:hypothetical protein